MSGWSKGTALHAAVAYSNPVEVLGAYSNPALTPDDLRTLATCRSERHTAQRDRVPQRVRKLTDSEIDELVTAYKRGMTIDALATTFGIHRTTVMSHLSRQQVVRRQIGLAPSAIAEAVRLYGAGWSLKRIVTKLSVDAGTVRARLAERGVKIRQRNVPVGMQ